MNHQSTSSLYNAPITKLLIFTLFGCTVFLEYNNMKKGGKQPQTAIPTLDQYRYSSLIKNQFYFSSVFEMVFGCFLLYTFRTLERIMGSSKYFIYLMTSMSFSSLIQLAFIMLLGTKNSFRSSPYSVLFSLFVLYIKEIPPTFWFRFLRIPLNNKSITYFLQAQTLILFPFNFISSLCGFLSGLLINSDTLGLDQSLLSRITIPRRILQFSNDYILPFLQTPTPNAQTTRQHLQQRIQQTQLQQRLQQQRGQVLIDNLFNNQANGVGAGAGVGVGGGNNANLNPFQQPVQRLFQQVQQQNPQQFEQYQQPNEEDIQTLVSMGFTRELSITALQRTGNLNDATNYLLGG